MQNRKSFREFRAAGATVPVPHPVFSISEFFEIRKLFTHFLLGFKRKILIFAKWNLPLRFFRAPSLFGGKKSKILENRVGKIAFYKVQGHILGLFARVGPRFFFSIFFREVRIFSRKKNPRVFEKSTHFKGESAPKLRGARYRFACGAAPGVSSCIFVFLEHRKSGVPGGVGGEELSAARGAPSRRLGAKIKNSTF